MNDLFYIQSIERVFGNEAVWWCAGDKGYTSDLSKAGKYTSAQCRVRVTEKDIAVPFYDIDKLAHQSVSLSDANQFRLRHSNICIASKGL